MRMNEADDVHVFLGPGARNRGAACDLILNTLPGVGYVAIDGIAEPIRVRFAHYTDAGIVQLGQPAAERQVLALVEAREVAAA